MSRLIVFPLTVISVLCFSISSVFAQTGKISAHPFRHIVAGNEAKLSVISWSTCSTTSAQVYVSRNSEAEKLFANGTHGTQDAPWIQGPGYYVFTLYQGFARERMLAWTSVTVEQAPGRMFGFNYLPAGHDNDAMTDKYWPTVRSAIAADLDMMSSMSGKVVRIMFWPQRSGYHLENDLGGGIFTKEYDEIVSHLPEFLQMCEARDLRVIIAFGNNYFDLGNGSPGHRVWQDAYGDFGVFINDTVRWMNGLVHAVESSPYRNTVIFYDYENEYSREHPNAEWYITSVYDWVKIPRGKRGLSFLGVPLDTDNVHHLFASAADPKEGIRRLDFADFHSYSEISYNADIESLYESMQVRFPDSTIVLGEFGYMCKNAAEESVQRISDLDLMKRATAVKIPYVLHWRLWDRSMAPAAAGFGWGFDPHHPKDIIGGTAELFGILANPDMEELQEPCETWACSKPRYWNATGTVPFTLLSGGPSPGDAATNSWFARISTRTAGSLNGPGQGSVTLYSAATNVAGGHKLFVNAYIRSNMANIRIQISEYNAFLEPIVTQSGPAYTPTDWSFSSYLHRAGSWHIALDPLTAYVIVFITAETVGETSVLDVDTVTAWHRP